MTHMAQRIRPYDTTIFTEMTNLAIAHDAINLGQGFPNFAAPDFVKEAAIRAITADINQYPPSRGRTRLRTALAEKMAHQYGLTINPDTQVNVVQGATEALYATLTALVDPGDEVIIFEPYFDVYVPDVTMVGGIPRFYTLPAPTWAIDFDQLEALFNDKTRLIIINTPHNPTGKVYTRDELEQIAKLCIQYDVIAVTDEVYEHILFDDAVHTCMAALPGMADRTVTISSMGKTFSVTGWKVGWAIASPALSNAILRSHQYITFTGSAPLQEGSADILHHAAAHDYYADLKTFYTAKRALLLDALTAAGLPTIRPAGTYYVMVDIGRLDFADDIAFCRHLTTEIGVAAIPPSAFYRQSDDGQALARFCFCKTDDMLAAARDRLLAIR